jgi:uncharacterized protein YjgD (DUF1641 family)
MANKKNGKDHNVGKGLSIYTEKIKEIDKQYSELNDEIKSLKRNKYLDVIYRTVFQILGNDMIRNSLKEEVEEFLKWIEIILSKFQ